MLVLGGAWSCFPVQRHSVQGPSWVELKSRYFWKLQPLALGKVPIMFALLDIITTYMKISWIRTLHKMYVDVSSALRNFNIILSMLN